MRMGPNDLRYVPNNAIESFAPHGRKRRKTKTPEGLTANGVIGADFEPVATRELVACELSGVGLDHLTDNFRLVPCAAIRGTKRVWTGYSRASFVMPFE